VTGVLLKNGILSFPNWFRNWGTSRLSPYSPGVRPVCPHIPGHYALDAAASSKGLQYALRNATGGQAAGVPMSVTAKWAGRASTALLLYSAYSALKAAQKEYKECMAF